MSATKRVARLLSRRPCRHARGHDVGPRRISFPGLHAAERRAGAIASPQCLSRFAGHAVHSARACLRGDLGRSQFDGAGWSSAEELGSAFMELLERAEALAELARWLADGRAGHGRLVL